MIESGAQLSGQRLEPDQAFAFACGPHLACFNTCCANKHLPLLPYDLLRLRRGLGLSSEAVLERYAGMDLDPVSGWPVLSLRLTGEGRCPLVTPQGCGAYAHRPAACRTYPLARAVKPGLGGQAGEEVFLRQEAPACLGWSEPRPITPVQWVEDQGLSPYQAANDALLPLFFHPRRQGRLDLKPNQIHAVILALYNLDQWRQFVARPGFAQSQGLEPGAVAAALASDEALLNLGRDWLLVQLFGPPAQGPGPIRERSPCVQ